MMALVSDFTALNPVQSTNEIFVIGFPDYYIKQGLEILGSPKLEITAKVVYNINPKDLVFFLLSKRNLSVDEKKTAD